ncbi:aminoglycoside phosphotransferase family protein [Actinoplanes sp. NEAU-A12]|uniref:Aminoglycoside phosphotransferase family protein n=1 Tax=Actinoplanes sandaracinus TaxID=3045177 RepID=A0ABT6WQA7_9ACTN|nr:aminoglycoside phosphotransferase family protein [Actinoplanes sandaracinus]MDI6101899.1 aminoglycoside phosphotransferase family protein [Actinoplanes sandaracinus]
MAQEDGRAEFSPASTQKTLLAICAQVGLDSADASLMRLGENAVYLLPRESIVVRIARSMHSIDDVCKEMRVARWLEMEEYPAVRAADVAGTADSPLVVDEHPVSFWKQIKTTPGVPTSADLGQLLRRLHDLKIPDWLRLPPFDPFAKVERRLLSAPQIVDDGEIRFLSSLYERLRADFVALEFRFPFGPVHGDAHHGNLLYAETGEVVILDFEAFCFGPREWDLSLSASYRYGFDWIDDAEYAGFVAAYGFDVSRWAGFPVLRQIRELGMTTWLMQLVETDRRIEEEFSQRISDLTTGDIPRRWRPF